jgi:hypothetical protein
VTKSRVFITQVPSKFSAELREMVPTLNVAPAEKFGDLNVMLPPNVASVAIAPLVTALKEKLESFGENDYLLALGDPAAIAVASGLILSRLRRMKLLKWDRRAKEYYSVEIKI